MLYHPDRFYDFCKQNDLTVSELCKSKKGRSVPYISLGEGERTILLTARHHACESTGSYVLEGVIEGFLKDPMNNTKIICIPFVDFDGVVDGDQSKSRAPHDHNQDYLTGEPSLYPEIGAIRKIADGGVIYGFDFHSPWHYTKENDTVFVVRKDYYELSDYELFGKILESNTNEFSLKYFEADDFPAGYRWNSSVKTCFAGYLRDYGNARLAFALETTYFGKSDNIFTQSKAVEFGRCFAKTVKEFDEKITR